MLLNSLDGRQSINSIYSVPSSPTIVNHVKTRMARLPSPQETINKVYELPIIVPNIIYLHAEAGSMKKATCIKTIWQGNYLTWPLINTKNVTKKIPGYEETQKGHIRGKIKSVHYTRLVEPAKAVSEEENNNKHEKGATYWYRHITWKRLYT